jgi:hypothetical protein
MKLTSYPLILAFTCLCIAKSTAQDNKTKPYTLFNPVPKNEMREFSIDRPDVTESPMSVDAGHFQFEGDLFKVTMLEGAGRAINVFNGLYKMGLNKNWDIHLGVEMYNIYQDDDGNTLEKGYGNTTIRLKRNLWGNKGDTKTALGIIPYVTLPTSKVDDEVTYGVGFPFAYTLTDALGAGAQFQFDFVPDGEGGHDLSYLQTVVIGGALVGALDFYIEGMGIFSNGNSIYTANGGLIYNAADNVKIDLATNLGLTDESPTRVYLGLSFRL